jgi:hypothetical protein
VLQPRKRQSMSSTALCIRGGALKVVLLASIDETVIVHSVRVSQQQHVMSVVQQRFVDS